jgi:hypothetical protein
MRTTVTSLDAPPYSILEPCNFYNHKNAKLETIEKGIPRAFFKAVSKWLPTGNKIPAC